MKFGAYIHNEIKFPNIKFRTFLWPICIALMGRGIVVGKATNYRLYGLGILSRWRG